MKAAGIIRKGGKAVLFWVRCTNDPTGAGRMCFALTHQMTKHAAGIVPHKVCRSCRRSFPAIAFIKGQHKRGDHSLIFDGPKCHLCDPPPLFEFVYDARNRLAMRLTLRKENDAPIRHWDASDDCWRALKNVGLRLMTKSNVIRLQPRSNRKVSAKTGVRYGRNGPLLPFEDQP